MGLLFRVRREGTLVPVRRILWRDRFQNRQSAGFAAMRPSPGMSGLRNLLQITAPRRFR